jgi:pimeloyl-ACP methyl ester carboxylesterase
MKDFITKIVSFFGASGFVRNASYAKDFVKEEPPYPFPAKYIDIDGEKICYVDEGKGRPLLLLHGSWGTMAIWFKNIPRLSKHYRVVAVDLPGFGRSQRDVPDVSVKAMSRFLNRFIDALGLEDPHLIGCSMGGLVALDHALGSAGTGKLILVSPAGLSAPPGPLMDLTLKYLFVPALMAGVLYRYTFKIIWDQQFKRPGTETDETAKHCIFYRQVPEARERIRFVKTAVENIQSVIRSSLKRRLNEIRSPVLLLWGDTDHYHPLVHGRKALPSFREGRLEIISDSGHFVMLESADTFERQVIDFLGS